MKKIFKNILEMFQNLNLKLLFKLNIAILKRNYSKYPGYVMDFEKSLCDKFNLKHCLSFSSGTAAFYASIIALKLKKRSKVLISSLTFPTVIEILKKNDFDIYYFDLDKNFEIVSKNIDQQNYDLLVLTHPFGFCLDYEYLKRFLNKDIKVIFDISHSQGAKISNIDHIKFADISFMSLQGKKSISGGEGGVIFTDKEDLYLNMINNHHPGHIKNDKLKIAGGINDLKLRMHPLAAILAKNDLESFDERNKKLKKKIKLIYEYLNEFNIQHPYKDTSNISGFHFGIPFFFLGNLDSIIIKKYNWYNKLSSLDLKNISTEDNRNFFQELHFLDLEWIKKNDILKIKKEINKIFKNVN